MTRVDSKTRLTNDSSTQPTRLTNDSHTKSTPTKKKYISLNHRSTYPTPTLRNHLLRRYHRYHQHVFHVLSRRWTIHSMFHSIIYSMTRKPPLLLLLLPRREEEIVPKCGIIIRRKEKRCNYCGKIYGWGTSNTPLQTHLDRHHPDELTATSFDGDDILLVKFFCETSSSLNLLDYDSFKENMRRKMTPISRQTMSTRIVAIARKVQNELVEKLNNVEYMSLTADTWKSPFKDTRMEITFAKSWSWSVAMRLPTRIMDWECEGKSKR